jgi:hypothetical protein
MPCYHVSDKLPTIRYGNKFLHQQAVQLVNICSATLPKGIFGVGLTAPNQHYNSVHICCSFHKGRNLALHSNSRNRPG